MDCSPPGSSVHGILWARILEWVAFPFSRRSSPSRDGIQVSCIAGRFFTVWATREAQKYLYILRWGDWDFNIYVWVGVHNTARRRQWHPTLVLFPGISHGWKSLVGCSPWGRQESDTTERLHFHFSLSCIGEGNGNPLQCSCLENPRDRGACWAAIYGVAQSQTQLKRLSSSSSTQYSP